VASENQELQTKPEKPKPAKAGRWVRISLLGIGLTLVAVFATALWLNPYNADGSPRSMATHTTLGLPPCNFVELTGKPCPSCGMTTSFALLVRGDVGNSLNANWAGTTLAVIWASLLVWCFASAYSDRLWLIPDGRGEAVLTLFVGGFLVLMLGRWVAILLK
jgi:hypothetical protein